MKNQHGRADRDSEYLKQREQCRWHRKGLTDNVDGN